MGSFGCLIIILIVAAPLILIKMSNEKEQAKKRAATKAAYDSYQDALARLKADPTNANLKQHALQEGRTYSGWTREQKATTIFDEMALSNDIAAATAGATKATAGISVEERLQALEGLRSKGLVTDVEYAAKRQKLLDEM